MFLLVAIILGFAGSLHCVGMCGPIALALPVKRDSAWSMLSGIFYYNSGRVITYAFMGLLFGLTGKGVALASSQNILSVCAGILMILLISFRGYGQHFEQTRFLRKFLEMIKGRIRSLFGIQTRLGLLAIGTLNGLLPCGLVYIAITGSMATGNPLNGALFMAAFGLGTLPAMSVIMFSKRLITAPLRQKMRKAVPVLVSLMACLLILRGMNLGIPYVSPVQDQTGSIKSCCKK